MDTVVRVKNSLVTWTPKGWITEDPEITEFCQFVWNAGEGGFHWDYISSKADARQLVAACKEWRMDAEIVSFEEPEGDDDYPSGSKF